MLASHEAQEVLRESQQGKGKPIISTELNDYRITAVGNRVHWSKDHKTFIDFLGYYIKNTLGGEWGNDEIAKPLKERHQIMQWYDMLCEYQKVNLKNRKGELQAMPVNGLVNAYYGLAYNLYLLQHNIELQDYLIQRLKQHEAFYAAYYETFVAAWFILAGFELRLEDERDGSRTHPEFLASRDGQIYSVEAKTRQPEKVHFDVGNQLYNALCIEANHPRVVFIDMNVGLDANLVDLGAEALSSIHSREAKLTIKGHSAPPAHVYVTNHPFHLALDHIEIPAACATAGFKIPDFGHGAEFSSYTDAHKSRLKYAALYDVQNAIVNYKIPVTFDGELPEFAFGEAERRFNIGQRVLVADGVFATLQSGIVVEEQKRAYLTMMDDNGAGAIWTSDLSDAELSAYKTHPDTFFGRVVPVNKNTENPLDLFEFFLNSYKNTPGEKLLEFMKDSPDIEELKKLSVEDLRYRYAEGLTFAVIKKSGSTRNRVGDF